MRKRKKSKKSKKKKKKKRKKKRNKSISSIENISDNDSVLDDDVINLTPPLRPSTPTKWRSLTKSPITPPLRPNSNMSIYSETSRRTPPLSQKYNASSPHTPPLVPRKSTASYHGEENSDKLQPNADGDVRKSVVYVTDKYYSSYTENEPHYHHHTGSRRSKSPRKHFTHISNHIVRCVYLLFWILMLLPTARFILDPNQHFKQLICVQNRTLRQIQTLASTFVTLAAGSHFDFSHCSSVDSNRA